MGASTWKASLIDPSLMLSPTARGTLPVTTLSFTLVPCVEFRSLQSIREKGLSYTRVNELTVRAGEGLAWYRMNAVPFLSVMVACLRDTLAAFSTI
jgi:hypothetical protein